MPAPEASAAVASAEPIASSPDERSSVSGGSGAAGGGSFRLRLSFSDKYVGLVTPR
jgi:hypothetical protein